MWAESENGVIGRVSGYKREEVKGGRRQLHYEQLHEFTRHGILLE